MKIRFFTKDPAVFPPQVLQLPDSSKVQRGPEDDRIKVLDYAQARPDRHGNFLYNPDKPQFDACEAYGVLRFGMGVYSNLLGRKIPFAFPGKVSLLPHDGEGINAFYSRDDCAVHFLEMSDDIAFKNYPEIPNADLRMAQSLDVGAHEEVGHLLLDGLKPEYLNLETETQAFHEAFGDISAMIVALQFNEVIARMIEETAGDLRKSNLLTRLGKEAGVAMQALSPHPNPRHYFLRDASFTLQKNWTYVPSENLAGWDPANESQLGSEPHNFSRFFSGLWYEIFVNLYEQDPRRSTDPKAAIRNARDIAARLIVRAVADFAPETTGRYPEIAKAVLHADQADYKGAHRGLLSKIFLDRRLLSPSDFESRPLPKIHLEQENLTPQEAESFLKKNQEALGIEPGLSLSAFNDFPSGCSRYSCRNQKGETFLAFHVSENKSLEGAEYRELRQARYDVKGSIKVGFDKEGYLFHMASDLLTSDKHERIRKNLRQCHAHDAIAFLKPGAYSGGPRHFFKSIRPHHKTPYFAYTDWKDRQMIIRRVPVFS